MPRRNSSRWANYRTRFTNAASAFAAAASLNEVGQLAAASGDIATAEALCSNHRVTLDEPTWSLLWQRRKKLQLAQALVTRPLTAGQLDQVIADERRVSVLAYALEYNPPSAAQALAVLARPHGGSVAREVDGAESWELPDDVWAQWCLSAGGHYGVKWLVNHPDVDPYPYVVDTRWLGRPTVALRALLARLLAVRPDTIEAMCASDAHPAVSADAAASHLLAGRDDLARAIARRDPTSKAHSSNVGAENLWHAWMALALNPFVSDVVVDELADRFNAHKDADSWKEFVSVRGKWLDSWRPAGEVFERAIARGRKYRSAISYQPETGFAGLTSEAGNLLAETFHPLWRGDAFDYCTLVLVADNLARYAPPTKPTSVEALIDLVAVRSNVDVLGTARAAEILQQFRSRRRISSRPDKTERAGQYIPRYERRVDDPSVVHVWHLNYLDDSTADDLGKALETEAQWQILFSLLAEASDDDNVYDLVDVARAIGQ
jgi:hypothetical protein